MKPNQFKKLNKVVEKAIDEIESNLTKEGENLFSPEVQSAIAKVKEGIVTKAGFTLEEYEKAEAQAKVEKDKNEVDEDALVQIAVKAKERIGKNRKEFSENVSELAEKIDEVDKKTISYEELSEQPHIPTRKEMQAEALIVARAEIGKIPEPRQLTEKDVEKIVSPMIPKPQDIPKSEEFKQDKIKSLKQDQIDYDFKKKDEEIVELKKEQVELKENLNRAIADMGSRGGSTSNKGGRFFNWGMPDKGSYGTAIPDDRYALKGEGATFVDDETPTGAVNGSNKTFTISDTPKSGSVKLFVNGQRQIPTTDYSITGKTITTVVAYPTGTLLRVDYRK